MKLGFTFTRAVILLPGTGLVAESAQVFLAPAPAQVADCT